MTSLVQTMIQNRLLQALPPASFARLQPHLEAVELPLKTLAVEADVATTEIFFIESGLMSMVAISQDDENEQIEVGHIGREGMTGIHLVLDTDRTPNRTVMQAAGTALRISADAFRVALHEDPALHNLLLRYIQTYQVQLAQSALANGRNTMHQRLARWLLMCHDRLEGDDLPLTHEFLSIMLGVRRSGVTNEIHILEGMGVIRARRGLIHIRDREKLEEVAAGSYGLPEREYERLIGGALQLGARPMSPISASLMN